MNLNVSQTYVVAPHNCNLTPEDTDLGACNFLESPLVSGQQVQTKTDKDQDICMD